MVEAGPSTAAESTPTTLPPPSPFATPGYRLGGVPSTPTSAQDHWRRVAEDHSPGDDGALTSSVAVEAPEAGDGGVGERGGSPEPPEEVLRAEEPSPAAVNHPKLPEIIPPVETPIGIFRPLARLRHKLELTPHLPSPLPSARGLAEGFPPPNGQLLQRMAAAAQPPHPIGGLRWLLDHPHAVGMGLLLGLAAALSGPGAAEAEGPAPPEEPEPLTPQRLAHLEDYGRALWVGEVAAALPSPVVAMVPGGGPQRLPTGWSHLRLRPLPSPPLQLRSVGGVPLWELLRRREVRELIGDRGGFSLTGYPRFVLQLPALEGWRLERLRLLLAPGSLMDLGNGRYRRYVLSGAPLQRLVVAFTDHPTPPRWGGRLGLLQGLLISNPLRPHRSRPTLVTEPTVTEAAARPFPPPTRTTLRRPSDPAAAKLVFGLDPRWNLDLHLQWLGGLVDGDGTLSARGTGTQLSIAGHRQEVAVLQRVQTLLNYGTLTISDGEGNSLVYTLSQGYLLWQLLPQLGPYLRHPDKRARLRELCHRLMDIPVPDPVSLDQNRGWAAGAIQADGSIGLAYVRESGGGAYLAPVVTFVNTIEDLTKAVAATFPGRGHLQPERHNVGQDVLIWRVRSQADVEAVGAYLQSVPFFGPKARRIALIMGEFYGLRDKGAHQPSSPHHPQWLQWLLEWARTWGGPVEQRAQLARFLPPEVVDGLVPPPAGSSGGP